jgi:hypothetical protein
MSDWGLTFFPINGTFTTNISGGPGTYVFTVSASNGGDGGDSANFSGTLSVQDF